MEAGMSWNEVTGPSGKDSRTAATLPAARAWPVAAAVAAAMIPAAVF
jgi:hypothetical protein